jgi:hypothetical protein
VKIGILDEILLMCSDVQGVLGNAILTAGLSRPPSLYHAYMVWHLAICVSFSHSATLYYSFYRSDVPFRKLRLFVMAVFSVLLLVFGIITWHRHSYWADKPGLCYRSHKGSAEIAGTHLLYSIIYVTFLLVQLSAVIMIKVFEPSWIVVLYYVHIFQPLQSRWSLVLRFFWSAFIFGVHVIPFAFASSGIVGVYMASSPLLIANNGTGEREQERWGFGQITAVFAVPAIAFAACGIWTGDFLYRSLNNAYISLMLLRQGSGSATTVICAIAKCGLRCAQMSRSREVRSATTITLRKEAPMGDRAVERVPGL